MSNVFAASEYISLLFLCPLLNHTKILRYLKAKVISVPFPLFDLDFVLGLLWKICRNSGFYLGKLDNFRLVFSKNNFELMLNKDGLNQCFPSFVKWAAIGLDHAVVQTILLCCSSAKNC